MESQNLQQLVQSQIAAAREAKNGRSTTLVSGGAGRTLNHLMVALAAGHALSEHANPGQATLQVLHGTVTLRAGDEQWTGSVGEYLVIPDALHDLTAQDDSAVLLTFVKG